MGARSQMGTPAEGNELDMAAQTRATRMRASARAGFTIIELGVSILVIAVLIGLLLVGLNTSQYQYASDRRHPYGEPFARALFWSAHYSAPHFIEFFVSFG